MSSIRVQLSLMLRASALALRVLMLRASLDVSRCRAHASRALALRVVPIAAILLMIGTNTALPADEPEYFGKNLNYWINVLRDRDQEMISLAFDAIRAAGPDAKAAVPDLIAVLEAPFSAIRVGQDSQKVIASKLYDIEIRTGAVDTLASMGEAASPATPAVIGWALTPRVIPQAIRNEEDQELYLELVMMDTEQRMRIAGAVNEFGIAGSYAIAKLLSAQDAEKRKFGVAILNEKALPIAAELLRSAHCEDRNLGLTILQDMDLLVARPHLDWLQRLVVCSAN